MDTQTIIETFAIRLTTHARSGKMDEVDRLIEQFANDLNCVPDVGDVVLGRLMTTLTQPEYAGGVQTV